MEEPIIVLGMHRSGTSAVAGVMNHLGVDMGRVGEPMPDNPRGHWEDLDLMALNRDLLKLAGGEWYLPPPHQAVMAAGEGMADRLADWWNLRSSSGPWGAKDPRLCLTLDAWLAQKPVSVRPRYVVVSRNPWASAKSLEKRHGGQLSLWFTLTGYYLNNLGQKLDDLGDFLPMQFENLIARPRDEVARLADWLGVEVTDQALEFVEPELDHQGQA